MPFVRLFTTGNLIQMKSFQSSKLTRSVFKPTSSLILVNINLEKFCFLLRRVSQQQCGDFGSDNLCCGGRGLYSALQDVSQHLQPLPAKCQEHLFPTQVGNEKNVSRCCHVSSWGQNHPWLRTTVLQPHAHPHQRPGEVLSQFLTFVAHNSFNPSLGQCHMQNRVIEFIISKSWI